MEAREHLDEAHKRAIRAGDPSRAYSIARAMLHDDACYHKRPRTFNIHSIKRYETMMSKALKESYG